jgi:hypothetical protein
MKYYLAMKRNSVPIHATMNLENVKFTVDTYPQCSLTYKLSLLYVSHTSIKWFFKKAMLGLVEWPKW